jgi:hypothetical protein
VLFILTSESCCLKEFRNVEKQSLLDKIAAEVWASIVDGSAVADPMQLFRCLMLTFADLKSYKFYYWFSFPALIPSAPFTARQSTSWDKRAVLASLLRDPNLHKFAAGIVFSVTIMRDEQVA